MQQWRGWCRYNRFKNRCVRLDRKSKYRFYLRMFFDFINFPLENRIIVYTKLGNGISLLNFKTVVVKALIGRYSNRKRSFPTSRPSEQKSQELSMPREVPTHMPKLQEKLMIYHCCKNGEPYHKLSLSCQRYGLYICLTKERNCFWSIIFSFPSGLRCLLNTYLKINYSFADFLVSFHNKYRIIYVVEYGYTFRNWQIMHRSNCSQFLKSICNSKELFTEQYLSY